MSTSRLAYDDAVTPAEMTGDCLAVNRRMDLPAQRETGPATEGTVFGDDQVRTPHGTPLISKGLASRAADLHLHLD